MVRIGNIDNDTSRRLWQGSFAVAVAVIALVAVLGGFGKVPPAESDPLPPGEVAENGHYSVRPLRAWVTESPPGAGPFEAHPYLVIETEVIELGYSSQANLHIKDDLLIKRATSPTTVDEALQAHADPWVVPARVQRADDGAFLDNTPPRLPVTVHLLYGVQSDAPPIDAIMLGVQRRIYAETWLQRANGWLQAGTIAAAWRLPVRDLRGAAESSP